MDLTPPALRRTISDEGRALFLTALAPGEAPRTVTAPAKEKQQHPEDEIAPARQARKHFSLTKFGKRGPKPEYPYELMGKRRPRGLRKPAA